MRNQQPQLFYFCKKAVQIKEELLKAVAAVEYYK